MAVYRARPSWGWASLATLGCVTLVAGAWMLKLWVETGSAVALVSAFIPLGIAIPFLLFLAWFPSIRYELTPDKLVLRYGPFRYAVQVAAIKRVRKRDLAVSLLSSVRLPGFAMFTVPYLDEGNVRMCATAAAKGIVLLETDKWKYGITPADEAGFLAELRRYLEAS